MGVIDPNVSGPILAVAAGVLVVSGAAKLRRPMPAAQAVTAVGLPGGVAAVRSLAVVEIAVGLACLIDPVPAAAAALGLLYLVLAGFVVISWRLPEPLPSCGCMGTDRDPPPHPLHAAVNVVLAGAGVRAGAGRRHARRRRAAAGPAAARRAGLRRHAGPRGTRDPAGRGLRLLAGR